MTDSSNNTTASSVRIREAKASDFDAIAELLPRLSDFTVPEWRNPKHLWEGDKALVEAWAAGDAPQCHVVVATDEQDTVLGSAVLSLREELLSHEPSAHLEVLVVAESAQGQGVGAKLMASIQQKAVSLGAQSMSLHVFANNTRARALYEREGFDGELMRYYKPLV